MYVKYSDMKEDYARKDAEIEQLKAEVNKLKSMIDNGLGWEDMVNDININSHQNSQ